MSKFFQKYTNTTLLVTFFFLIIIFGQYKIIHKEKSTEQASDLNIGAESSYKNQIINDQNKIPNQATKFEKQELVNPVLKEFSVTLSSYKDIVVSYDEGEKYGSIWWTTKDGYSIHLSAEEIQIEQDDTYIYENAFQEAIKSKSYANIILDFASLMLKYGYREDSESKNAFNNTKMNREIYIDVYTLDDSICVLSQELAVLGADPKDIVNINLKVKCGKKYTENYSHDKPLLDYFNFRSTGSGIIVRQEIDGFIKLTVFQYLQAINGQDYILKKNNSSYTEIVNWLGYEPSPDDCVLMKEKHVPKEIYKICDSPEL